MQGHLSPKLTTWVMNLGKASRVLANSATFMLAVHGWSGRLPPVRELARCADALDLRILASELLDDLDGDASGDLVEDCTRSHLVSIQPVAVDAEGEPLDVHHGLDELGMALDEIPRGLDEVVADIWIALARTRVGPEQAEDLIDAPTLESLDVLRVGCCHGFTSRDLSTEPSHAMAAKD